MFVCTYLGAIEMTAWKLCSIHIHLLLIKLILLGFFFVTGLVNQLTKSRKESRHF